MAEARIVKFFSFRASCWGEGCGGRDGDRTCLAIRELFAAGGRVSSVQSGVYLNSEHTGLKYARKKKDSHTFEADQASFKGSRVSPPDSPCYHFAFRPSQRTSCRAFNMPEDSGYLSFSPIFRSRFHPKYLYESRLRSDQKADIFVEKVKLRNVT